MVTQWHNWGDKTVSKQCDKWIEKAVPNYYEFAIAFEDVQIGAISVTLNDSRNVGEIGWILNKRYWKKWIAIEAAFAIKDFALKTLKLQKLVDHCDYRNSASSNLMQKLGMTLENDNSTRTYSKSN